MSGSPDTGSIIIVVATDAPLLPHQLKRLARRASLGLARTGSYSGDGSGDIFIVFSTANPDAAKSTGIAKLEMFPNDRMDPIFQATVQATEEAIVNALVAADTMTGIDDHKVEAIPHDKLTEALKKYNQLSGQRRAISFNHAAAVLLLIAERVMAENLPQRTGFRARAGAMLKSSSAHEQQNSL